MQKFVEHEHEKMDRTVELFLKYRFHFEVFGCESVFCYRERVDKFVARRKKDQENSEVWIVEFNF